MHVTKRSLTAPLILILGMITAACNVDVAATQLTVVQAQEDGFFENGDEPCVATIKWRVIPGTPGSASTEFVGNLVEVGSGADDGAVLGIPANMGAVHFPDIQNSTLTDLLTKGNVPELVGTVMVVMESDLTP